MIAITGAGIVSAIGHNTAEVLASLRQATDGIAPVRQLDTRHRELPVGEVKLTNAELAEQTGAAVEVQSRTALLGILALGEALAQAGLTAADLPTTALVSGTTVGSMDVVERLYTVESEVPHLGDCAAVTEQTARHFGHFGFVTTCSTACSSAANAFILGAHLIRSGRFDRVVVGGSECLSRFHVNGFHSLMILDSEPCRPFDAHRAGLNLGEGAAFMVLESEAAARRRGAHILAVLSGWGNACDAYHQTASSEDGEGAFLAMQQALTTAGLSPTDIGYINAHGTGTPNNDASECAAIARIFGAAPPPFSSTKSATGHTTSASGAIEMVICLLALRHGFLPANLHWQSPMPKGFVPITRPTPAQLRHVLCNSFAFGGNDTTLILSTPDHRVPERATAPRPVYVKAALRYADIPADELPRIPPMVARRLSGVLKRALLSSLTLLRRIGVERPEAIVTGTAMGCVDDTRRFLIDMVEQDEQWLKPTHFIHSTHNTIGSLIAIHTHAHGYNSTYSHGADSFTAALLDAYLQIGQRRIDNALVGAHDEDDDSIVFYLDADPDNALCTIDGVLNLSELCGRCFS